MKQSDILSLNQADLESKLKEYKEKQRKLKIANAVNPIETPSEIKILRRTIARIATELTKRQREEIQSQ